MARGRGREADETAGVEKPQRSAGAKVSRGASAKQATSTSSADNALLTAKSVAAMDEATLRRRVIKPLLEALRFEEVRLEHGSSERGKDLTCWRPDTLAGRVAHAVVVKADKLTGRAEVLNRSVGGVVVQLLQCFGTQVVDRTTGNGSPVDRCLVITSQDVTAPARDAFWAAVYGASLRSRVVLIDGERLWELIRQHLPDALPAPDRVAALPAAETAHLPAHEPAAQTATPVTIGDDSELQAVLGMVAAETTAVERHGGGEAASLAAGRQIVAEQGRWRVAARLVADDGSREPLVFDGLALELVMGVDGRMSLSNEEYPYPLLFRIELAFTQEGIALDLHYELPSRNVVALHALAALSAKLQRPCTLRLLTHPTYQLLLSGQTGSAMVEDPDPVWVARLADLVLVQDRTGVTLVFPPEPTAADWAAVGRLGRIVRTGRLGGAWTSGELTMTVTDQDGLAPILAGEAVQLRYRQPESVEQLADTAIPLGPVEVTYAAARLVNPDDVRAALAAGASTITLQLVPGDDTTVERHYLDWDTHDEEEATASASPILPGANHLLGVTNE